VVSADQTSTTYVKSYYIASNIDTATGLWTTSPTAPYPGEFNYCFSNYEDEVDDEIPILVDYDWIIVDEILKEIFETRSWSIKETISDCPRSRAPPKGVFMKAQEKICKNCKFYEPVYNDCYGEIK